MLDGKTTGAGVGLFLVASAESFNIYSALCSSPWTAENFGADEEKARSCLYYSNVAAVCNIGLGVGASLLAGNWYPLLGVIIVTAFMYYIYKRALRRGMNMDSTGWENQE